MKYYLLTDSDFESLTQKLELEKYNGNSFRTDIAVEVNAIVREIKSGKYPADMNPDTISERLSKSLLDSCHRHFNYYVRQWVQEMKK